MAKLTEKLRQLIRQAIDMSSSPSSTPQAEALVDESTITHLMRLIEQTQEEEYSCEETFALLDEYAEIALRNDLEAEALMPLVKHHLDMCPECAERYEALLYILESEAEE
jgi:hypothetical protein